MTDWTVAVGDESTSAVHDSADKGSGDVFVCAHGAGGSVSDRGTLALAKTLRARGFDIVRFNFLYRQKGSSRPDQMPKLELCFAAVAARARKELKPKRLFIGGRSMGGRTASMMASKHFACDGLMLYAYPLHPPGQPEKLRDAHLPLIDVPVLCVNGTRDPFCTPELMMKALEPVTTPWEMHWVEAADHSFHVPKSSGRNDAAVMEEIGDVAQRWSVAIS